MPCPCTLEQAEIDCNFEEEHLSNEEMQIYYPGGSRSFRQTRLESSNHGQTSQCVYDSSGKFLSGPNGGGRANKYRSDGCRLDPLDPNGEMQSLARR